MHDIIRLGHAGSDDRDKKEIKNKLKKMLTSADGCGKIQKLSHESTKDNLDN